MRNLPFFVQNFFRLCAIVCFACILLAQHGCNLFNCDKPCEEITCSNPVVNNPAYYNSQYELQLGWTVESSTTYTLNSYSPALQQVIAYEVQGGNTTLQMGQLYPLTLSAETECCQTETPIELEAACNYPDFFSVTISPTMPVVATFEWSPVSGAVEYLITIFDEIGTNIQQVAASGDSTSIVITLPPNAAYAVIQTICVNGEPSPRSPPIRTNEGTPITSIIDVEKINGQELWRGRSTLPAATITQIIELNITNPPSGTQTYAVQVSYDNGGTWQMVLKPTQLTAPTTGSLLLPRIAILPVQNPVIIELVITP